MNLKINLDENIYLVQNIAFLMVKIIDKKINIYKKSVSEILSQKNSIMLYDLSC